MNVSRQPKPAEKSAAEILAERRGIRTGDRGPRARTYRLLVETAIGLMQSGETPSVSDVSEAAQVSRATAYRYFPNQSTLVETVVDAALGPILEWRSESADPLERIEELFDLTVPRICEFEATFRAALKLALEQWRQNEDGTLTPDDEFRRGHRIAVLGDAIGPLRETLGTDRFRRLVDSLALIFGIEAIIISRDISGLDEAAARDTLLWAAKAMIRQATDEVRARDQEPTDEVRAQD